MKNIFEEDELEEKWLFSFWKQPLSMALLKEKHKQNQLNFTILTQLFQFDIVLIQEKLQTLEYGQQITDIFAEYIIDYDKDSQIIYDFYAMVQNRFHYAITGKTATEIIDAHADHRKEHMGMVT